MFVYLGFGLFFPLGCKAHRSANGVSIFKKCQFFGPTPPQKLFSVKYFWSFYVSLEFEEIIPTEFETSPKNR